ARPIVVLPHPMNPTRKIPGVRLSFKIMPEAKRRALLRAKFLRANRRESDNSNMQEGLLPLFPLQVVLLPGARVPLHIFEDRYKERRGEVLKHSQEFGVVLASEKGIVDKGCSAIVDKVLRTYPDGRMDILTLGRRRFEILLLNDEKAYLRGAVEFFD